MCFYTFKPFSLHIVCVLSLSGKYNLNAVEISVKIPRSQRCCSELMIVFLRVGTGLVPTRVLLLEHTILFEKLS